MWGNQFIGYRQPSVGLRSKACVRLRNLITSFVRRCGLAGLRLRPDPQGLGGKMTDLNREGLVLAAMYPNGTRTYSPVQIQKLLFLLDRNIGKQTG